MKLCFFLLFSMGWGIIVSSAFLPSNPFLLRFPCYRKHKIRKIRKIGEWGVYEKNNDNINNIDNLGNTCNTQYSSYPAPLPLLDLFYPIAYSSCLTTTDKPIALPFFNQTFVAFRKKKFPLSSPEIYCDVCPHMGASLSKGWVDKEGRLRCPYHGIAFTNGTIDGGPCFIKPRKDVRLSKTWLNSVPHMEYGKIYWAFRPSFPPIKGKIFPHIPSEHYDTSFRYIEGETIIDQYQDIVNENLLDMLHISYVHSFGNRLTPVPVDLKYQSLGVLGGRTSFMYSPNSNTISTRVGGTESVIVENEFHLPSITVTRVKAGDVIKTVWTSSLPLQGKKTKLFWRVYRNFWCDPYIPFFNEAGDWIVRQLMVKTLEEDKWILGHIHENQRYGPLRLKYDITIQKYRQAVQQYRQSFDSSLEKFQ